MLRTKLKIICKNELDIHKIITPKLLISGDLGLDVDWKFYGKSLRLLNGGAIRASYGGIIYNFSQYKGPGIYDIELYNHKNASLLGYFWNSPTENKIVGLVISDDPDDIEYAQEVSNPYICEKKKSNKNRDRNETVQ